MTTPVTDGPLTQAQVNEFNAQGYLILPGVFDTAEVAAMGAEADRILELMLNSSLAVGRRNPRLDASQADAILDIRKVQPVQDLSDIFRQAANDERFVGPLRQLMDAEPILMEEKLNYKQWVHCPAYMTAMNPRVGDNRFPLHHDWGYYRKQGYPQGTLSSAIAIDATTDENGPIRVIPGTHRQEWPLKNPDPASGDGVIADGVFEDTNRVNVIAPPGSVFLFHAMLVHDSLPNLTGRPRRIMIYSHYPGNYSFEEDARNRRGRALGQEVEQAYRAMVEAREFTDIFHLPD